MVRRRVLAIGLMVLASAGLGATGIFYLVRPDAPWWVVAATLGGSVCGFAWAALQAFRRT